MTYDGYLGLDGGVEASFLEWKHGWGGGLVPGAFGEYPDACEELAEWHS